MLFESRPLDRITEADVRELVTARRREGATLEYKQELYGGSYKGKKELLLDVCSFANSSGGDIIIGVAEERNSDHATGYPDPSASLGVDLPNPEQLLLSYESQILDSIDERLLIGLRAVPCDGRQIIILRIPNSLGNLTVFFMRERHISRPAESVSAKSLMLERLKS